jgi:hypothetical protein
MKARFKPKMRADESKNSPFFEVALVLMRPDHVASFTVNADHGMM